MEETNKVIINLEDYNKLKESEFKLNQIQLSITTILSNCTYDYYDKDIAFSENRMRELAMSINPLAYSNKLTELKEDYEKNKDKEE